MGPGGWRKWIRERGFEYSWLGLSDRTMEKRPMTNTPLRLSASLSLLVSLVACSGGDATETAVELEEGFYGLVGTGELGFESDFEWTIFAQKPLKIELWIEGSKGGGRNGGVSTPYLSEGPCVYRLRYSQEEVKGAHLLKDLLMLGGAEASDAVLSAVPTILKHKAFRYSWELESGLEEIERDEQSSVIPNSEVHTATKRTAYSRSSGWVPGSKNQGENGMTTSMTKVNSELKQFKLGEPLILGYWAELTSYSGSIGVFDRGEELSISYSTETQESREVPFSEYEGRAWALKLTLTEAE